MLTSIFQVDLDYLIPSSFLSLAVPEGIFRDNWHRFYEPDALPITQTTDSNH